MLFLNFNERKYQKRAIFGHILAILMQNMAIFMLYLASIPINTHVLLQNGQKIGEQISVLEIIFNGTSRITHCYSTMRKIIMIGWKIRKWQPIIPSQLHYSRPLLWIFSWQLVTLTADQPVNLSMNAYTGYILKMVSLNF